MNKKKDFFTISESKKKFRIPVEDIIRLEANRVYSVFHLISGEKHTCCKNIGAINNILTEKSSFIRIHKSHLININHIKEYQSKDGGICVMKDGIALPISREKKSKFLRFMK